MSEDRENFGEAAAGAKAQILGNNKLGGNTAQVGRVRVARDHAERAEESADAAGGGENSRGCGRPAGSRNLQIGRVRIVRDRAERLPDRLGSVARDWIADRQLAPQNDVTVEIGFAAEQATVEAIGRAAAGVLDPIAQRVRRWLDERTVANGGATRALGLHRDFSAWCASEGLCPTGLAAFARRLHILGVEKALHSRTRQSWFQLGLRVDENAK